MVGPEESTRLNLQSEQTPCQKAKMDSPVATFLPKETNRFPPVPLSTACAASPTASHPRREGGRGFVPAARPSLFRVEGGLWGTPSPSRQRNGNKRRCLRTLWVSATGKNIRCVVLTPEPKEVLQISTTTLCGFIPHLSKTRKKSIIPETLNI